MEFSKKKWNNITALTGFVAGWLLMTIMKVDLFIKVTKLASNGAHNTNICLEEF